MNPRLRNYLVTKNDLLAVDDFESAAALADGAYGEHWTYLHDATYEDAVIEASALELGISAEVLVPALEDDAITQLEMN